VTCADGVFGRRTSTDEATGGTLTGRMRARLARDRACGPIGLTSQAHTAAPLPACLGADGVSAEGDGAIDARVDIPVDGAVDTRVRSHSICGFSVIMLDELSFLSDAAITRHASVLLTRPGGFSLIRWKACHLCTEARGSRQLGSDEISPVGR
jgi:hypothetical protein